MKKFAAVLAAMMLLIVSAACADAVGTVAANGFASIVKHAAVIHQAAVDVKSRPGLGSTFTVTFPKKSAGPAGNA